jgi:hypothetical protein
MKLLLISIFVYLLNIPFGYWRSNVKAFSLQWFLAIHIPVPFIIGLRLVSEIGFAWYTYVFLVAAFFLGQKTGSVIMKRLHRVCRHASSCLVMDIVRCIGISW